MMMTASRRSELDDVGDPNAEPGTRPWAVHVRLMAQTALKDERSKAGHLRRLMDLLSEHRGYLSLCDKDGKPFPTFEAFCSAAMPFGLGYELAAIDRIIDERKTAEARARAPKELAAHGAIGRGRDRDSNTTSIGENRGADYLTARIARDHPEVLKRMAAGEFKSVRQAALSVGIVRPRASVYIDDPDAVSIFLAKHFDADEITSICNLAIHERERREH